MDPAESQRRLAARIVTARSLAGMRQEDLARRVGVSATTIKSWEICRHAVSSPYYNALAAAFGITVSKLVEGIENDRYDEEEWALDLEYILLDPRLKERAIRELSNEQNRRVDRSRDLVGAGLGRGGYEGAPRLQMDMA